MNRWPYSTNPLTAFDEMEMDAPAIEALAIERDSSADALEKMLDASPAAVRAHRLTAKRLRRIASALGYIAGRVDRLHLLDAPIKFEDTFQKRAS